MAPKGIELASAYISVGLSTANAGRELKQFVRGINDIEIDIDANVRPAAVDVGKWRKQEESDSVEVDVDADTTAARQETKRWRATEQANPLEIQVKANTRRAQRDVDALSSNLFKFGRSDVLKLNVGAASIASLPMMASGLAEVAAGIQQVSQAALALPGVVGGATASIGTLVFGLSGIGDAYDAMSKASDDAAKSGGGLAAQQRAEMSASFGLRNAIVDQADARKDVNRAIRDTHRNLQDLNLEMRGGVLSEKRAVLELEKARERLATGDFSDYREALLDVDEAQLRVDETRVRSQRTAAELNEANAKGIANSDLVVAANERLVRSEQGVAQANAAVAAAATSSSAAQENAASQMSKLSANGQDFVNAMMDVKGPFQTLRNLVQDNIFEGLDDQLRGLSAKSMPMLEKGLGGIGKAWNRTFDELFRVAGEDDTQGMLSRIFGNTEDAQDILTNAIDPLAEGLGVLTEAGTRALPRMADGFVTLSDRFANFITQADESGKLDEWIGESITALGHLGEVALNVGKMFTGITGATEGTFLENLERWTNTWQTWLNSAEGQNTLRDIFDEGKRVFEQWRPILEDIPGLFKGIYDGASTYIGGVLEVVAPITDFLSDHPGLVQAAAGAYLVFKSAQVIGSVATLATSLTGIGKDLDAMPGKADKAATGINRAFSLIVIPEIGRMLNDQVQQFLEDNFPGLADLNQSYTPDQLGKMARDWVDRNIFGEGRQDRKPVGTNAATGTPGVDALGTDFLTGAPSKGPEGGLQVNTIAVKRAIESRFPEVPSIGGYRQDKLKWHPNGLALDVMIPGGSTRGGRNPQGKAYGDQIWAWLQANGPAMGVDLGASLWQTDQGGDHYDHIHVATTGGGYPSGQGKPMGGSGVAIPPAPTTASTGIGGAGANPPKYGPPSALPPAPKPAPPPAGPLEELLSGVPKYDQGGPWPPGTLGMNTSGKPEFVLNPEDVEYLKSQGIDPASLQAKSPVDPLTGQHGTGGGMAPGPMSVPGISPGRTEGYIPAAAGNTAPVGQGGLSNFLDLGESFFHNLIDTGAQLGSMAVSAAAAAGSFGAGAAAGPAASAGIQMAAEAGKRGVSYLYDLGGIWGEAFVEQAFPFGAPRWLGSANPMAFMPQGIPGLGEKKKAPGTMGNAKAAIQSWAQPGNPAMANGTAQQGAAAALLADPGVGQQTPPPPPQAGTPGFNPMDPSTWLPHAGVFDNGGVWPAKSFAVNLSKRPEYVFTQKQMAGMAKTAAATAATGKSGGDVHFHSRDDSEMWRRYQWEQRRKTRQYSGRP